MSQSSYFKSRPDLVTLGGGELGGGNLKILENTYSGGITLFKKFNVLETVK